ncbi:type 1 glutamine amidotransferase [Polymorphobacter megasporae]|uniref:type 1 glutamine amidotransferase n=1 Tax=Glacieibacterium megasporae TaxID=2835787 RepID=UPI001C1DCFD4|nr:type 1 glutamine amidotransferase [Polymorphobacter megasporae]UAJ09051.1 type 1 glutamine amidotransferase [Polymorphobacter megasporae]
MQNFLVAESETREERDERRRAAGKSAGETYAATLEQIQPGCSITIVAPADADAVEYDASHLRTFDAVFVTGSPIHVYDDTPEVRRQIAFMRSAFASGTPSFGSCAGLQLAVVAAGGKVREMPERMEAGIARRITATEAGRDHPLLKGRAASWDAAAIHGDEVEALPEGAILLASNGVTRVQAAEIRHDGGVFWGVQYHPELALGEIAVALRRQVDSLVAAGLADNADDVNLRADQLTALHRDPGRRSLRWMLGVDAQLAEEKLRRTELSNFLANLPSLTPTENRSQSRVDEVV